MIRFRCIRCQHAVQTTDDAIGRKMYCPVCFLELTVPAQSTVRPVDESMLYAADAMPVDVREMGERKKFVSLRCPVCHTNIAVTKELIGTKVVCPECDTKVLVPKSLTEKADKAIADKIRRSGEADKETYALLGNASDPLISGTIRIYCKLCGTMMYAADDQTGTELICPDCETKNLVPRQPKKVPLPPPLPMTFEGGTTFGVKNGDPKLPPLPPTGPLVPVVCALCGTRMYAQESETGGFKTCPDCGRQTEIKPVPKSELIQPVISPDGGYGVNGEETPAKRPTFRTLTDYRYVEGSLDKELYDTKPPEPREIPSPSIFPLSYDPAPAAAKPPRADSPMTDSVSAKERIAAKKAGFDIDNHLVQFVKRPPLPKYPFWTRIFVPFINSRLWGSVVFASILCLLGFLIGSLLPGLWVVICAPFGVIVLILGLSLLANTFLSLFLWTAVGNDFPDKDDWQEYRLLESGALALWLFLLTILAVSPGYLLASYFPLPVELTLLSLMPYLLLESGSFILFFPVFFLSSMESGSYLTVLAKETCRSLLQYPGVWLRFYAISLLLAVLFFAVLWLIAIIVQDNILFGFAAVIPAWFIFSLFYARFMGRLGWILEESGRPDDSEE